MPGTLHIISFDVPFPANYGGVIDVYYKLQSLKQAGVKVILHCFTYGRTASAELEAMCEQVHYYKRKTGFFSNLSLLPYNVKSRMSRRLEDNLLLDGHPILFEVLHTCYLLSDKRFINRRKIYRHSNIEHDYYRELALSERNVLKKIYLNIEAFKLKRFEPVLRFADLILAVNQKDTQYFKKTFPKVRSIFLPSFHPHTSPVIKAGTGNFVLFHGNLGVSENYEAAAWLLENVFSKLPCRCVIAGLNPPLFLKTLVAKYANAELVAGPDESTMNDLIQNAQAHLLYTTQPTGLKLKLLNVLFRGRFVICNPNMLSGTGIQENNSLLLCSGAAEFIAGAEKVLQQPFTAALLAERQLQVQVFDNQKNCEKLIAAVFTN